MATSIHEFQSRFKGGVRPNLFVCRIDPPTGTLPGFEFHCKGTSMPASQVGNIDVPYHGRQLKVPGDRTFADWTATVFNDSGMIIRGYFEEWMASMQSHEENTSSLKFPYGSGQVTQLSRDGSDMRTYIISSMYPTEVAAIDLAWDSNDAVEEYAVTFAVNHWFAGPGTVSSGSDSGIKGGISVSADTDGNIRGAAQIFGSI
jgi:hypothetical protein